MVELRAIVGKPNLSQPKYDAIYLLAKKGLSPQEVVDLTPADIKMIKGKMVIKDKEFTFEEAKVLAEYINNNQSKIADSQVIFYGSKGNNKIKVDNLCKVFRKHLKDKGETLENLGWSLAKQGAAPVKPINNPSDIEELLKSISKAK